MRKLSQVDIAALAANRRPSWLEPAERTRAEGENDARLLAEKPPHW